MSTQPETNNTVKTTPAPFAPGDRVIINTHGLVGEPGAIFAVVRGGYSVQPDNDADRIFFTHSELLPEPKTDVKTPNPTAIPEILSAVREGTWIFDSHADEHGYMTVGVGILETYEEGFGYETLAVVNQGDGLISESLPIAINTAQYMAASKELYEFAEFNLERNHDAGDLAKSEAFTAQFIAKWFGKYPQFKPAKVWDIQESCNHLSDFLRDRALAKARGEKQ